jgi:23S rRNA pseudouridine2605 synthase
MSLRNNETHYNKPEGSGEAKSGGRARKPLSPERAKDKSKRSTKEGDRKDAPRSNKPFRSREESNKPFRKEGDRPFREKRSDSDRLARDQHDRGDKPAFRKDGDKPFREKRGDNDRPAFRKNVGRPLREKRADDDRLQRPRREEGARPLKKYVPFEQREGSSGDRPKGRTNDIAGGPQKPSFKDRAGADRKRADDRGQPKAAKPKGPFEGEDFYEDERPFTRSNKWDEQAKAGPMTLNKYMAHSGISSRRDAAALIKEGKVLVNGTVMQEPGYRVKEDDKITYEGKLMKPQKNLVYILLNKPKGFITTTDDEKGRRTVMDLVANAGAERLYPVGRLDRATTGVLLITNDGDLAQKLSHPSHNSKKIYQVTLSEPLTKRDFDYIIGGNVKLEDGLAPVDALAYLEKKNEIGIEIHSGKNRIVRRIFESLGYVVEKLDRVVYAGLTKKNVSRGKWRFLTEKEIINLKHYK